MKPSTHHFHNIDYPPTRHFQVAKEVLLRIKEQGEQAYIVGGAVRDWLLQREVTDIDIATSATPDMVCQMFTKHIPTGIAHGTVSVYEGGFWFEITTFRKDGPYEDGRRPKYVSFSTDLFGDLSRRDFTINAMAMDANGMVHDPFSGQSDLHNRLIRAVGNPLLRLQEDGLRAARAFRFAAMLNFTIEEETWAALTTAADLLHHVAVERRQVEWDKFLESVSEPFCTLIPDEIIAAWTGVICRGFANWCKAIADLHGLIPRAALIVWNLEIYGSTPNAGREYLHTLRYSNKFRKTVLALTELAKQWLIAPFSHMTLALGKLLADYGDDFLLEVIQLCKVLQPDFDLELATTQVKQLLESSPARQLSDLAITGSELIEALSMRGPEIGTTLSYLFEQVAKHTLANSKLELIEAAKAWRIIAPLDVETIRHALKSAPKSMSLYGYQELPSTNDEAITIITSSNEDLLAVFADLQTAGRGRQGKIWVAPAGTNIALSIAIRIPQRAKGTLGEWPLFAALIVQRAITVAGVPDVLIKWPNDLLIRGKKVSGILTELRQTKTDLFLVVGTGINVNADINDFPENLRSRIISLKMALQHPVSRNLLIANLLDEFYQVFKNWESGMRFLDVRSTYESLCSTLGQHLQILQGQKVLVGQAVHIDDEGTLWVKDTTGTLVPVRSGEIIE